MLRDYRHFIHLWILGLIGYRFFLRDYRELSIWQLLNENEQEFYLQETLIIKHNF